MKPIPTLATCIALLLGLNGAASAQALSADQQEVADAANSWLTLIDSGDYQASWEATATLFRDNVTPEQWEAAGRSVTSQTGAFISRELQQVETPPSIPNIPPGDYRAVMYLSRFANASNVREQLILRDEGDDGWRVVGYMVLPPQ